MNYSLAELFLEIILIGFILSLDSFTAALAMGLKPFNRKQALIFASASGLTEGVAALMGALAGQHLLKKIAAFDHWVAVVLLLAVAANMAYEGFSEIYKKDKNEIENKYEIKNFKFHSFTKILIVSFATSLDALGVGISLGISQKPLIPFTVAIILGAFTMTLCGLYLARKLSDKISVRFTPVLHFFGASVLVLMAYKLRNI